MNDQEAEDLLERYLAGTLSDKELSIVDGWYLNLAAGEELPDTNSNLEQVKADIWEKVRKKPVRRLWPRIAAAASILIACSIGGFFVLHHKPVQQVVVLKPGTFKNDVLPGKNNAYITLSNGQRVIVNATSTGSLAQQGGTNIQKNSNGQVVYETGQSVNTELVYNTYVVPRGGGKHELRLADGTLVVLDAGSSIRFPVAFNGKDRRVAITGQVYFEVVHNDQQPFFVTAKGQTIQDIGTHFNINAFDDEPTMKTTLLEGSIKINMAILTPGEQAITNSNGTVTVDHNVDLKQVVAWKNDKFEFNKNTDVQAVMRQLARWYDLDVSYQGANKKYHFAGDMPRDSKLSDVLKILQYNGLQFAVDGNKLTVYQ